MSNPAHKYRDFWKCFHIVCADCRTVLEVGCGDGNIIERVPATIRVGIEIEPLYPDSRKKSVQFLIGDALYWLPLIQAGSYDLILLVDVLEHFEKDRGLILLRECKRVGRKILLWSPEGECPQDEEHYDGPLPYTPSQDHRSAWSRGDLTALGFDVAVWPGYHVNRVTGKKDIGAIFAVYGP